MGEFELIRRYFMPAQVGAGVVTGVGDDGAVLEVPPGQQLVVSIDTLVEGVHFLPDTAPARLAERLVGAAASDLAAMAATPAWLTLALTLPQADEPWLEAFSGALLRRCDELGFALVGGDTTRGPLCVLSAQVHGLVPSGRAWRRRGALAGDRILVSGTLGDSRGGLETLLHPPPPAAEPAAIAQLRQRFYRPEPRLELAQRLREHVHAAIDLSDGLLGDLGHLLEASAVGARLQADRLPLSPALQQLYPQQAQAWALAGGEDFELCLTVPPERLSRCLDTARALAIPLTEVGEITAATGLQVVRAGATVLGALPSSWDHFRSKNE
jgi:thiamine-monophosphate kinase